MTPLLANILAQPDTLAELAKRMGTADGRSALEHAAALLRSKKRVVLSGMGASLFACRAFEYELARQGVDTATVESAELLYFAAARIDSETAVVLVSRSGESVEVIRLLPALRQKQAATLGVTNVPGSTLEREANASLLVGSAPDQMVAIQSYTTTAALFTLLAATFAGDLQAALDDLIEAADALRRTLSSEVENRAEWDSLLTGSAPLYILGRGPSSGTIAEGVLLMHETAKAPAVGMSIPQFRHGPVEAVDRNFRAAILASHPVTAELDDALAADLKRMGATVRLCTLPDKFPGRFADIAEVIPLQIAAYRKAELNGVPPGEFRWAPQVTTTEAGFFSGESQT